MYEEYEEYKIECMKCQNRRQMAYSGIQAGCCLLNY